MKREAPRLIGDLIPTAMPQIADRLIEYHIRRAWNGLVGPDIARRTSPRALANGILDVAVDNSPWLHELTLRSAELTDRVRARFAEVRALRFVPGAIAAPEASAASSRRERVDLSAADLREIDETASLIPDPTLAAAARRLLTRARRTPIPSGGAR